METVLDIGNDIYLLDSRYIEENVAAIYLLRQKNQIAIIETGTMYSLPYIESALHEQGLGFADVAYIIPTHVHLDHCAGAGALMNVCENAQLIVHPRGARHIINPTKLIKGASSVYGKQKVKQLYGDIMAVDGSRVVEANDGFKLNFNGREIEFLDTPGHAKHHFCIWDNDSKYMFTGDTFGVSYREFDIEDKVFIFPTTTPIHFDPQVMLDSIDKIVAYNPQKVCLTHFGAIDPTVAVVTQLKSSISKMCDLAIKYYNYENAQGKLQGEILSYLLQLLENTGVKNLDFCADKLSMDATLNAQGLIYWQKSINK